jgi:hypothetical protein
MATNSTPVILASNVQATHNHPGTTEMRNPYNPPDAPVNDSFNSENNPGGGSEINQPERLGGWLVLVGIGIVISPFRLVAHLFSAYSSVFSNGAWEILTTPGTEAYSPLWAPLVYGEIAVNGGLVLVTTYIAFLFFSRKKIFPKWYIGTLLFNLLFIFADALVVSFMRPDITVFDADTTKEFGRSLVSALIWIPYMLISKRVKKTFVK